MSEEAKKPFDAGEKADVKKRTRTVIRNDTLRLDAFKTIMGTPNGRAYIWWLLGEAGIHRTSFSGDPHRTSFNEGQRNLGLMIFAEIHEHCAGDYAKMVSEAQQRKVAEDEI